MAVFDHAFNSPSELWRRLRRAPGHAHGVAMLATFGIDVAALALPIFILQIYDRVLPNQSSTTLSLLVVGLVVIFLIEMSLRVLRSRLSAWLGMRLEHGLRVSAAARLLNAPLDALAGARPGSHYEAINGIATLRDIEAGKKQEVAIDLAFAGSYLTLIALLGGLLVVVPLALLALFALVSAAVGRSLHEAVTRRSAAEENRRDALLRTLGSLLTVKALALQQIVQRRHERHQGRSSAALREVMLRQSLAQTLGACFTQANTVFLLAAGAELVMAGNLSLGGLAACTLLAGRAVQPIQAAMSIWTNMQSVRLARAEIDAVLALPDERREVGERFELEGRITLDGVRFRYRPDLPAVIDGLSLSLEPGVTVGIEATAGAGKSTLVQLVLGLLRPQSGRITIDGRPLPTIALGSYRRQVATLSADSALYSGSIIDNLTNFREGEAVNEALYLSFLLGLDEPIRRLPNGFDHQVLAGDSLPAGLAQAIALVRELANGPRVVLFDEADLGLDHDGRQRLIGFLRTLAPSITLLVISSRPDVLALAQKRYRLAGGRLVPVAADGRALVGEAA